MKPQVYPGDWALRSEPPPLGEFGWRFLAEGDSWFTIGTLVLPRASNLLLELQLARSTAIVSCAYPGDTLKHMVDGVNDAHFDRLLRHRRFASYWEAIVFSCGGNDLIDAVQVPARDAAGQAIAPDRRLLLTAAESAGGSGPERHISEAGWQRFAAYLHANLALLVQRRDMGPSKGRPLFLHTYALPTARASGAPGASQGWLYPALVDYAIAPADWPGLVAVLFGRLQRLLLEVGSASGSPHALAQVHVFNSAALPDIRPAAAGATGESGDWVNEIHLTPEGYGKVGKAFGAYISQTLAGYP